MMRKHHHYLECDSRKSVLLRIAHSVIVRITDRHRPADFGPIADDGFSLSMRNCLPAIASTVMSPVDGLLRVTAILDAARRAGRPSTFAVGRSLQYRGRI